MLVGLLVSACGGQGGTLSQRPTGLSGALPGGDGRALRAYRAEYRTEVLRTADSLVAEFHRGWQRGRTRAVAEVYADEALLLPGDGVVVRGRDDIGGYFEAFEGRLSSVLTWRDHFEASGEMVVAFGRYQFNAPGGASLHRGFHFTVLSGHNHRWAVRLQGFLPRDGTPLSPPARLVAPLPPAVSAEEVERRRGGAGFNRVSTAVSFWATQRYWSCNGLFQEFAYAWNRSDAASLAALFTDDALLRVPGGDVVEGLDAVRGALAASGLGGNRALLDPRIVAFDASERTAYLLAALSADEGGVPRFLFLVFREEDGGMSVRAALFTD